MDQNQTIDNDLQKAIDDITNSTNTDPVFSDPVAAPSSIPEGDTGELGEPIGPFPEPQTPESVPELTPAQIPEPTLESVSTQVPEPAQKVEMIPPSPEPIAPFEPIDIPELNMISPEPSIPTNPEQNIEPPKAGITDIYPTPAPTPTQVQQPTVAPVNYYSTTSQSLNTNQIKEAALRDLIPLLNHLNMTPSQKFNICRNIIEDLRDYTVLEQAYRTASDISDATERAEALLYLVESINKM